ncbi:hypothetical protein CAT49_15305 [Acinetobacter baumannii]|uniref:Uncharacterized protein n=1 Tax=Acinetobacter baumannii 625974 TaxID=1310607 RepID=A0A009P7N0_ACIBA|nr:hypothetical protein J506_3971 [Acinetobacter baumannii 625974]OTR49021.1 hypothetical protein CAT49_15305 [Acinetobacter baumannii]
MAYLCETIQIINSVQYGVNCVESASLYELSNEARDAIIFFVIKVFAVVYAARKVLSIFK